MNYSKRLGEIQDKSFQIALDRFGLGGFVSAEAIPHGLFGQNVFVTSTKGEYVFRGNPLYPGQFEIERFMAEQLHSKTKTPVPWPYFVDEKPDFFGWPYAIMPRLTGLQLASSEVRSEISEADCLGIAEAMGVNLAIMHQLQHPYPGFYDPKTDRIKPLTEIFVPQWVQADERCDNQSGETVSAEEVYRRWICSRVNFFLGNALKTSDISLGRVTTENDAQWVASVLEDSKESLLEPFHPCFVMDDYKEGNTVAEKIDGRWRITGVFDLGESYFGDGEADLSRTFAEYRNGKNGEARAYTFLHAYLNNRKDAVMRPGFQERFGVYTLMDRLIIWAHGRRLGWFDGISNFRSWCEPQMVIDPGFHRLNE